MARTSLKMSGGMAKANVIDQPYYLKAVPMNPYIGTVHNGVSTEFNTGFSVKKIPFLYRFRHNILPTGIQCGFFSRNPMGKHVHWLEVSTIEKLRIRAVGEEAFPPMVVSAVVIAFTIYHCWRYIYMHPDLTNYNVVLWTTKPWVMQTRFSQVHPMDKPIFRYHQRVPEYYNIDDPIRMIYGNQIAANDPYFDKAKELGLEKGFTVKAGQYNGPDIAEAVKETVPKQGAGWKFQA